MRGGPQGKTLFAIWAAELQSGVCGNHGLWRGSASPHQERNPTQPKNHPTNQQSTDYQEGPGSEGYSIITSPHAAARFSALNKQLSSPIRRQRRRRRRRPSVISQFRGGGDLDRSLVARVLVRTTPNFGRLGAAVLWMYVPTHGLCCTTNLRPLRTPAKTPWSVVAHGGNLECLFFFVIDELSNKTWLVKICFIF